MQTPLPSPIPGHVSPLVLADRLLALAQDADRAGMRRPARQLLRLACAICGEAPPVPAASA